jgi:predicted DNA-binding transcriptional regulator YafY
MRRADRLFQIVQHLRARRLTTAAQLARWLEVSERTVYRDIRDLAASGIPVDGEAGVGYRIDKAFELTPLMFTYDEIEALVAGIRMVQAFAGPGLHRAAQTALSKITLAVPAERRGEVELPRLFVPSFGVDHTVGERVEAIRKAITGRRKLDLLYEDQNGQATRRMVRPLGLYFWGTKWTLAAWCESREDFRQFRLDRIHALAASEEAFREEEGRSLSDFLKAAGAP